MDDKDLSIKGNQSSCLSRGQKKWPISNRKTTVITVLYMRGGARGVPCRLAYAPEPSTAPHARTQTPTTTGMKWTSVLTVVVGLVCLLPVPTQAQCPSGWIDINAGDGAPVCLYFRRAATNWEGARSYCQGIGGQLAKLNTDLHRKVIAYINSMPAGDLDDEAFWLGGSDLAAEGTWRWIDNSLIPMGGPQWYLCTNQPSGGDKKNCLCIFTPDFHFHSCTCDYNYFSICQI